MVNSYSVVENEPIEEILNRILERGFATRPEGYRLIRADGSDLVAIMAAAARLRDRSKGRHVSYSRNVFIPLTNMCRDKCAYCTFAKAPTSKEARTLSPEDVLRIAEEGARFGCKEALFSLGDKPELVHRRARAELQRFGYRSTVEYLHAMAKMVVEDTGLLPHLNPGVLTYEQMAQLREVSASMGLMLESVSERLLAPGEAHFGCPDKVPSVRLRVLEDAGKLRIPFTTGILIGIGETREERVDSLIAIAEIQRKHGHIQEVIIQNFRAKPDIRFHGRPEPSLLEMLRTIAAARLILGAEMNIQAPPNLTPESYALYLFAGVNDWGGVSPVTDDHINPEAPWPKLDELEQQTREAGFILQERLAIYPEYIIHEFVAPPMWQPILRQHEQLTSTVTQTHPAVLT